MPVPIDSATLSGTTKFTGSPDFTAIINKAAMRAALGLGNAATYNVQPISSGAPGVASTTDTWFAQPPVTKTFDLDLTNGKNAFAILLPDGAVTLPDHEQFNITFQDYSGSSYVFPPSGNYELNIDGTGVSSGNVDIGASSAGAVDVFQALANQLQIDLLSYSVADSYWDGTAWNIHVLNGVGGLTAISVYSLGGSLMTAGSLILSADGANPLTGWSFGMDGNVIDGTSAVLLPATARAFRINDIQLIPNNHPEIGGWTTYGATTGIWNTELGVNSDGWGVLVDFGYGGFTTGGAVKSLTNGSADTHTDSTPLTLDYIVGDSLTAQFTSPVDQTNQQFATLRVSVDFKS